MNKNLASMKLFVGLAVVWTAVRLSRSQCVLEKEYFCSSIPNGCLENLTVAHNLISEIRPNMFSSFTNLTTLNLANNQIRGIASGSFKGLPKLTSIDLSGNNLTILTRSEFNGLSCPVMKLGSNPWHCSCELQDFGLFLQGFPEGLTSILFVVTNLGVINSTVFNSPSLESVTSLALANSGITKIEAGAFRAFRHLTKLSLYQNSLTNVMASWLFNPGCLENLTVAHNLISEIRPNMFSSFTNLTTLNLANNQIRGIASGSFKGLPKLTSIDLSGNNLTILTRSVFNGLRRPVMKLGSNPWHCSCELQDFGLFLQDLVTESLLEDAASVVCRSPPSLEGVQVWNISSLNCSLDILSSSLFEAGFHKAGLPALLTCLVLIFFILLLFLIWMVKRDEPVQPRKEATDLSTGMKASNQADSSTAARWQSDAKSRPADSGKDLQARMLRVRAKSASAILLQTEFHRGQRQVTGSGGASQNQLTAPHVVLINPPCVGREGSLNFMESWYYNLQEGSKKDFQNHNANSFLAEVCIDTPVPKACSVAAKQILQEDGTSEIPDDDKSQDSVENAEPFLYLSVTTATEERTDAQCKKEAITNARGSHLDSLRRVLTWPYEKNAIGQGSKPLSVRGSFIAQFFLPVVNPGESQYAGNWELEEDPQHLRKENQMHNGSPELNREAKLAKETEPPHMREVMVAAATEPVDIGKSELDEELRRQCDLCGAVRKDYQVHESRIELNAEAKPTNQAELQKHSKVTVAARGIHNSQSTTKATKCPPGEKKKQLPKTVSSQSRIYHEIHPLPPLSDDTSQTSSPCDEVLLENNAYNYINLLHEVVENHGRWTRERWKQTHRMRAVHPAKSQ